MLIIEPVLPSLKNVDPNKQLLDLDRADCEESLYDFLKSAWRYIDPSPWKDGWHIDAIAEHLQAVVDGQITDIEKEAGETVQPTVPVISFQSLKVFDRL